MDADDPQVRLCRRSRNRGRYGIGSAVPAVFRVMRTGSHSHLPAQLMYNSDK